MTTQRGFSLVELSIVLVILGLLTGGILAGQSLIRAAELRSVTTEYQRYIAAVQSFRDKFMGLPGDIGNATKFWGDDNTYCPDAAITNGTPGTCNGNGDGNLSSSTTASTTAENYRFWQQLALAGLIEGSYTGISGPLGNRQVLLGTNAPASKLKPAGWYTEPMGIQTSASIFAWEGSYGNPFYFGAAETNDIVEISAIKPEELWNIDSKLDDGQPAYGNVRDYKNFTGCHTGTTPATASYNLSNNTIACIAVFITGW